MIIRRVQNEKEARLFKGKAILLFGPRQTGKSTLIHAILSAQEKSFLYLNVVLAWKKQKARLLGRAFLFNSLKISLAPVVLVERFDINRTSLDVPNRY